MQRTLLFGNTRSLPMSVFLITQPFFFSAVQHERAPRASLAASQCPSLTNARRHGFGFSSHAGFFGPAASVIDFPAYQLIYPQPTFPFQFGIKPHSLGLPHGLGLRIFNCPGPNGSIVPNFRTAVRDFPRNAYIFGKLSAKIKEKFPITNWMIFGSVSFYEFSVSSVILPLFPCFRYLTHWTIIN